MGAVIQFEKKTWFGCGLTQPAITRRMSDFFVDMYFHATLHEAQGSSLLHDQWTREYIREYAQRLDLPGINCTYDYATLEKIS